MPKKVKVLSDPEVRRLTHSVSKTTGKAYNALHAVGGVKVTGLLLQVTPSGAKSWIYRTLIGNKRRSIGLGSYPSVTLAQARAMAEELQKKIKDGIDPIDERKKMRIDLIKEQTQNITFSDAMHQYVNMRAKGFTDPRQADDWRRMLTTYALPHLGDMPVKDIELSEIKKVLDPIWETKTSVATKVRGRIFNILGWSAVHEYRSGENPARWEGYLSEIYEAPNRITKVKHHAAMPVEEVPEFVKALHKRPGGAVPALEFLILTASRTAEVVGSKRKNRPGITWQEVDLNKKLWTIPADRMKNKKEHRVPLTDRAIEILKGMGEGAPHEMIFKSNKGEIPSDNYLTALLDRMERPYTVHGFRSTFKDWARENTQYRDEITELALSHVNSDETRAAYARSDLLETRRELMQEWEKYCAFGFENKGEL